MRDLDCGLWSWNHYNEVCVSMVVRRMNKNRRRHEEYYVACLEGNQMKKKETAFKAVVYEKTHTG